MLRHAAAKMWRAYKKDPEWYAEWLRKGLKDGTVSPETGEILE